MKVYGLMLGRKGSVGFPGKNFFPVFGRPLMAYPLLAARNAKHISKCFISTDDEKIKDIGNSLGAEIIDRPKELATAAALGEHAYVHGYQEIKKRAGDIDLLVLQFCNAPTILAETIDRGIEILAERKDIDSVVTVSQYNMWSPVRARKETVDGLLEPFVPFESFSKDGKINCDRDAMGAVLFADMSVSIVRPRCLENLEAGMLPQKWMGQKIFPLKQWGGLDVDYEWQVPQVEFWLKKHGFSETETPYGKIKGNQTYVKSH